jgi:glucose-1-phosphate thymidylyltransferase
MKGVILAGGTGSRLYPLTKITNKHLLPVYNKPMIYFPLQTLIETGVKDILIVSGKEHAGDFLRLLGSGKEFGVRFTYEIQDEAGGIAQALSLAENFADNDKLIVILGDNIIEDSIKDYAEKFRKDDSAFIFLKEVPDPERFGVAELNGQKVVSIEEKPKKPKSNFAVTGIYMYPFEVFDVIKTLKPSPLGELEITDVNNYFIKKGKLKAVFLNGFWSDAGTFESLFRATKLVKERFID